MKNKFTSLFCVTALGFAFQANADQSFTSLSGTDNITASGITAETITVAIPEGTDNTATAVTGNRINISDLVQGSVVNISINGSVANPTVVSTIAGEDASVVSANNSSAFDLVVNNSAESQLTSSGKKATIQRGGFNGGKTTVNNSGEITNTYDGSISASDQGVIDISGGDAEITNNSNAIIRGTGTKAPINVVNEADKTTIITNRGSISNQSSSGSPESAAIAVNGGDSTIDNTGEILSNGAGPAVKVTNIKVGGVTTITNSADGIIQAIDITGGSADVSNLNGSINAATANDYAIFLSGGTSDNLALTVNSGSQFLGKISSGGAHNIIKVSETGNVTASAYKALVQSVRNITVGSNVRTGSAWFDELTSGNLTSTANDPIADLILNGGSMTNSGAMNSLTVNNHNSTATNSAAGTITTFNISDGTATNNGTISGTASISGGSTTNNGTISGTTNISGGTAVNNGTISATTNISGGATTNNGVISGIVNVTNGNLTNNGNISTTTNISGGTVTNNDHIYEANISGGTVTNNSSAVIDYAVISNGYAINKGRFTHTTLSGGALENQGGEIIDYALQMTGGTLINNHGGKIKELAMSGGSAVNSDIASAGGAVEEIITANLTGASSIINNSGGLVDTLSLKDSSSFDNRLGGVINEATQESSGTSANSGDVKKLTMKSGTVNNASGALVETLELTGGNFNVAAGAVIGVQNAQDSTIYQTGGTTTNTGGTLKALSMNGGNLHNDTGTVEKMTFTSGTITSGGTISNLTFNPSVTNGFYGNIASTNAGSINLDVDSSGVTYANILSGGGNLIKNGVSRLSITGVTNTHSGTFNVVDGELKVNGITASQVIVENGALLSGTGTIGTLNLQSGGTLASGNSIGTLNATGDITLNSGSTDLIEYNNVAMDKTQTSAGNISVAGNAIFSLFNYPALNFVISQNILETTSGTRTGTFDSTTTTNSNYIVSTSYTDKAVRATISRKLDAATLDAPLAIQNSISRVMNKSIADQLQAYSDSKKDKAAMWVSYNSFNGSRGELESSSNYSFNGDIRSVGVAKKAGNVDIAASIFNSQSNANRFDYFGKDKIETNGGSIALGANYAMANKSSLYSSIQFGFGVYDSENKRNVSVNGADESANSKTKGNFRQLTIGTAYNAPISETGKLTFSVLAGFQETRNNGFNENGLTYGNLSVSKSKAKNFNFEIAAGFQDEFARIFMLPNKSFYRIELTGYQSNLYAKNDATATQGNASYMISSRYNQNFTFGGNVSALLPITKSTSLSAKFTKRMNGNFKESMAGAELKYQF